MAATGSLGNITGSLTMESAAFIRDLGKASNAVAANTAKMNRSFAAVGNAAKGALAGFLGVQGVRALGNLARSAIDAGDDIGASATKLGIGAEALQRFRFAALQTDVDVSQLDAALKVFSKNLATGTIKASTGDIGNAFGEWIARIQEAPTHLEKVELAVKAFGKQYQAAILIAEQGGVFADQFKKANVISNQAIKNAGDLDNALRSLSQAAETGFNTGFLEAFTGKLGDGTKNTENLNTAMRTLGGVLGGIIIEVGGFINKVVEFINDHPGIFKDKLELPRASSIRDTSVGFGKGTVVGPGVLRTTSVEALGGGGMGGRGGVNLPQTIKETSEAAHIATGAIGEWSTSVHDALGRTLDDMQSIQHEGTSLFASMQTPMEEYASSIERLSFLQEQGAIDAETFARAHQQLTLGMASNWLGAAGAVTGALASIFKENKAFAIANVVINTAEAIVSALKNPPGPPFSYVYAAAAAATGAAQLAAIMSAQPGGGSKSKALSKGSSASATTAGADRAGRANRGAEQAVTIQIVGDVFGPEHFRKIAAGLNQVSKDGTPLLNVQ